MDNVTINSIDTTHESDGYVLVDVTVTVSGTAYTPTPFTVQALDAPTIVSSVKQQAETYRASVEAAIASNPTAAATTDLSSLDGTVIDL
jgi:hypothetical protein